MRTRKYSALHYAGSILRQVWTHPSNNSHRLRAISRCIQWQARKRLTDRPRHADYFGLDLLCYPDSNSASNVLYFTELYDPTEMSFMIRYLKDGDGYIDVGANIGTYSLLASTLIGHQGRIVAFEPHPVNACRFRENMAANAITHATLIEAAVADVPGHVLFTDGWDVSNRIVTSADSGKATVEVPKVTLDHSVDGTGFAMGKLDVEGFETAAFRGAEHRLAMADPPVWQIEIIDHQLEKAGSSRDELIEVLLRHDFLPAMFDSERCKIREIAGTGIPNGDLLAVHDAEWASVEDRLRLPHDS